MKKNVKVYGGLLMGLMQLTSGAVLAAPSFAKTPLWQTPAVSTVRMKIEAVDTKLAKICAEYRDLVETKPGETGFDSDDITRLRAQSDNMLDKVFTAKFRINPASVVEGSQLAIDEANRNVEVGGAQDPLPLYTTHLEKLSFQYVPSGAVNVFWKPAAMLAISKSVGLTPLAINVAQLTGSAMVLVKGKDSACDLLSGEAWVEYDSRVRFVPEATELEKIQDLYAQVGDVGIAALAKKKSAVGRAAVFGFKLDEVFQKHSLSGEQLVDWAGNLVETLFDQNMQTNLLWQKVEEKNRIVVPGEALGTIKLSLGR